jgi:8-oxo-dGTP diphosphatase
VRQIVNALLVREGRVLLARRSPRRKAYPGKWSFPGGHVEADETLEEALVREMREEVGLAPLAYRFLISIVDPHATSDDPVTYHIYVVAAWQGGEPAMLGDEHTELKWFTCAAASSLTNLALDDYRPLLRGLKT